MQFISNSNNSSQFSDFSNMYCPNEKCKDHNIRNHGNIGFRCNYGKNKDKNLLYCRTCDQRFSETRNTAFFGLQISKDLACKIMHHAAEGTTVRATARLLSSNKDTVNRIIRKTGEHCMSVLSDLLTSLKLTEVQLDELWAFVQKKSSSDENVGEHWIWTAIDAKTQIGRASCKERV